MPFSQTIFQTLAFSILLSCGTPGAPKKGNGQAVLNYFDLKGFMGSEALRLSSKTLFSKTVYVNGEKETKELEDIDFGNELKPFFDSDINKPAWAGKYNIDSTFNQNKELIGLHYQSNDEKLKTKKININFEGKDVTKILIENTTSSSVANTYQTLTYQPLTGFSIESMQDVALMDENYFKIEVAFQ